MTITRLDHRFLRTLSSTALLLTACCLSGCGLLPGASADAAADPESNPEAEALAAEAGVPGVATDEETAASETAGVTGAVGGTSSAEKVKPDTQSQSKPASDTKSPTKSKSDKGSSAKADSDKPAQAEPKTPDEFIAAIQLELYPPKPSKKKKSLKAPKNETPELTPQERSAKAITLTEKLLAHPDASHDQKVEAWRAKLKFLSRGVKAGWTDYSDQLAKAVDTLNQAADFTPEAEYGSGLLLVTQYFSSKTPVWRAAEKISEHAHRFPNGDTGVRMYLAYAGTLVKRNDRTNAERVCNVALWELKDHPEIERVRDYAMKIPLMKAPEHEEKRVPQTALQRQLEREAAEIRSKLPLKLDHATTLTDVQTGSHSIGYRYEVSAPRSEIMPHKDRIEKTVTEAVRSTLQTRLLLKGGVVMHYAYFDKTGRLLFQFAVKGVK